MTLIEPDGRQSSAPLTRLRKAGEEVCLVVSVEKTKIVPSSDTPATVTDGDSIIKIMEKVCYLGSTVTTSNSTKHELTVQIRKSASDFRQLCNTWRTKISLKTKIKIYNTVVIPTLLYGSEIWATTKRQEQQLDVFDFGYLTGTIRIKWWDHRCNSDIHELTQQPFA